MNTTNAAESEFQVLFSLHYNMDDPSSRRKEVLLHVKTGVVLVSDSYLMGYLGAAGMSPVSDYPKELYGRLWWSFSPDDEIKVREAARSFYGLYTGAFTASFVRKAMEIRSGFKDMAIQMSKRNLSDRPMTLRRL